MHRSDVNSTTVQPELIIGAKKGSQRIPSLFKVPRQGNLAKLRRDLVISSLGDGWHVHWKDFFTVILIWRRCQHNLLRPAARTCTGPAMSRERPRVSHVWVTKWNPYSTCYVMRNGRPHQSYKEYRASKKTSQDLDIDWIKIEQNSKQQKVDGVSTKNCRPSDDL